MQNDGALKECRKPAKFVTTRLVRMTLYTSWSTTKRYLKEISKLDHFRKQLLWNRTECSEQHFWSCILIVAGEFVIRLVPLLLVGFGTCKGLSTAQVLW